MGTPETLSEEIERKAASVEAGLRYQITYWGRPPLTPMDIIGVSMLLTAIPGNPPPGRVPSQKDIHERLIRVVITNVLHLPDLLREHGFLGNEPSPVEAEVRTAYSTLIFWRDTCLQVALDAREMKFRDPPPLKGNARERWVGDFNASWMGRLSWLWNSLLTKKCFAGPDFHKPGVRSAARRALGRQPRETEVSEVEDALRLLSRVGQWTEFLFVGKDGKWRLKEEKVRDLAMMVLDCERCDKRPEYLTDDAGNVVTDGDGTPLPGKKKTRRRQRQLLPIPEGPRGEPTLPGPTEDTALVSWLQELRDAIASVRTEREWLPAETAAMGYLNGTFDSRREAAEAHGVTEKTLVGAEKRVRKILARRLRAFEP